MRRDPDPSYSSSPHIKASAASIKDDDDDAISGLQHLEKDQTVKERASRPSVRKSTKANTLAQNYSGDALRLYEILIQSPSREARNLAALHSSTSSRRSGQARILREDFCSSAKICQAWLSESIWRTAIACDVDPQMIKRAVEVSIEEGRSYLLVTSATNGNDTAKREDPIHGSNDDDDLPRLLLLQSSVLDEDPPLKPGKPFPFADIVCALNFSINYLLRRRDLIRYLSLSRKRLRKGGVLILDEFGGESSESTAQLETDRSSFRRRDAVGNWQKKKSISTISKEGQAIQTPLIFNRQALVDSHPVEYWSKQSPVDFMSNRIRLSLNFRFREDGSWLRDAFVYTFRVWSIAELLEAIHEAGFDRTTVYINYRPRRTNEVKGKSPHESEYSDEARQNEDSLSSDEEVMDKVDDEDINGIVSSEDDAEYDPRNPIESFERVDGPRWPSVPYIAYVIGCVD